MRLRFCLSFLVVRLSVHVDARRKTKKAWLSRSHSHVRAQAAALFERLGHFVGLSAEPTEEGCRRLLLSPGTAAIDRWPRQRAHHGQELLHRTGVAGG